MLHPYYECMNLYSQLANECKFVLKDLCTAVSKSKLEDKFGKPMLWIGIYIAVASLLCTVAMGADLLHGFRNRKLWFPCKYFTANAASLTVIAVAMKLPVDLSSPMLGDIDKLAYEGSITFMCIMMVNLMPSLASMSHKELLTNLIALAILMVTIAVNVCIGIQTGVVSLYSDYYDNKVVLVITIINVALLLLLLVTLMSSTLAIPTSKGILESKYKASHKRASHEQESMQRTEIFSLEKITQHVSRYWVMAGTGSPQFVMVASPTCSASGVICVSMAIFHLYLVIRTIIYGGITDTMSDYRWSKSVIFIIQAIGVAVGTIAPLFRCFSALSFQLTVKWSITHIKVYRVEKYWTQKLSDWKQIRLHFPIGGRRFKPFVHHVKNQILSSCIGIQKATVMTCKAIGLIPIFFVICYTYCFYAYQLFKRKFCGKPIVSNNNTVIEHDDHNARKDLSCYVLQLNDEVELAERTLKGILKSLNRLIEKAEKQKPKNLLKFLESPIVFEGVEQRLDCSHASFVLSEEPLNSWSLTVVTLTSIIISIPNIPNDRVDSLLKVVDEGLVYASIVEESLNSTNDSPKFQRAAKKLWPEVEDDRKWLNHNLQGDAFNGKTVEETIKLLTDRAKDIIDKLQGNDDDDEPDEILLDKCIAASMYRITRAILHSYENIPEPVSEKQLFMQLSTMISDVLRACFTNLPQVIARKCYASSIEKREESVKGAAQLLGQTKEIMEKLQGVEFLSTAPYQNGIC